MDEVAEEVLAGGNMAEVSRRGEVVLRTSGAWSPTVHRLLGHLQKRGVAGVPEPRGFAGDGRERVEYLAGEVPSYPLPDWVWRDQTMIDVAERLRAVHDASQDFDRTGAIWQLPVREPAEVICHNDFAPYNLVFDDAHRLTGVIDWDTASPGPRIRDLAYVAYRLVPLVDPAYPDAPPFDPAERRRRLALLIHSYGLDANPTDVASAALDRVRALADFTASRADPAHNSLADHLVVYQADITWLTHQVASDE